MIDLYTWTTPNGRKASIALEELGLAYTAHAVDISKDEQFKPEFLKISPNNRIPAIVDRDNGTSLMESGAILIYLADKTGKLLPREGEARYRVIEWLMWQMGGPGPMLGQVHHFVKYNKGKAPYAEERYLKEAHRLYGVLDRRLAEHEFVADAYSIADIAIWPWISRFEWQTIDMSQYPNVKRWYTAIAKRPAVQKGYKVPKDVGEFLFPDLADAMSRERLVPLIVAVALFMENMDSTVIATSLPAIAADIGTSPLALKLAVTSYLLSLAVFIPASGWTADRFGARTVFRAAIAVFVLGSIGCALSGSLADFVIARIVQGMGGAMMTPVGRLVLVRSIDKRALVGAMVWVTIPAMIGPVVGPPVGGFITTYVSWHWIFLINVPIGLVGIILVTRHIENIRAEAPDPFDFRGMVLAGSGMVGLAFDFSVLGLDYLPWPIVAGLIGGGAVAALAYVAHARRTPAPVLDLSLLAIPTFRASVLGGFLFRIGVGALRFLLPLLLQIGFRLTPFQSGLVTFSSALGAMTMKAAIAAILRRFGFRNVLTVNALVSSALLAACAAFTPDTPIPMIMAVLLIGGFFRSLEFTSINTIAYADISPQVMSRATSLTAAAQQVSLSMGVAIGALAVELMVRFKQQPVISAADFPPAFLLVAVISACSAFVFWRLPADAGAELADRMPAPNETSDQRVG